MEEAYGSLGPSVKCSRLAGSQLQPHPQPHPPHLQLSIEIGPAAGPASTVQVHYLRSGLDDVDGAFEALGLTRCAALGFDIEVRPAFRPGVRYPTSVIQVSSLTHCAVVSVGNGANVPSLPASLHRIVSDAAVLKIGCGVRADLERLQQDFGQCLPPPTAAAAGEGAEAAAGAAAGGVVGFLELSLLARLTGSAGVPGESDLGLRRLSEAVLGMQLSKAKALVLSRWDAVPLSASQVRYAAMDAAVAAHLAARMLGVASAQAGGGSSDGGGSRSGGSSGTAEREIARRAAPYANAGPALDDLLKHGDAHVAGLPPIARACIEQELRARAVQKSATAKRRAARLHHPQASIRHSRNSS